MAAKRVTGHLKLIERKGGRVWYLKTRVPGRTPEQTTERLGAFWNGGRPPAGHYTRRMAEDALSDYLAAERRKVGKGVYERDAQVTAVTFGDAAAEFLRYVERVRQIDAATVRDYRGVVDGYLVPEFGDRPLKAITPDHIDAYKERLIGEGRLSTRVIVRHLTVLHGIFKRARRVYGLERNPASADLVERPKVVYTGEFDTLDRDELELLAGAAADAQDAAIYRVAAYTGLRQGELLGLRWRDVDFVGGLVHVRRNYTDRRDKVPKGRKVRSVPMTPDVLDALARLKGREHFTGDDELVFCTPLGGYLDPWALRRRFYRALKCAGLRRIRFHDLRHHFGSAAITKLDGYAVQSYMGHAHYSTTQRYLHHKPRREDARLLHEAFGGVSPDVSRTGHNGAQLSATEGG
jgi:integrase